MRWIASRWAGKRGQGFEGGDRYHLWAGPLKNLFLHSFGNDENALFLDSSQAGHNHWDDQRKTSVSRFDGDLPTENFLDLHAVLELSGEVASLKTELGSLGTDMEGVTDTITVLTHIKTLFYAALGMTNKNSSFFHSLELEHHHWDDPVFYCKFYYNVVFTKWKLFSFYALLELSGEVTSLKTELWKHGHGHAGGDRHHLWADLKKPLSMQLWDEK